MNNFNLSPLQSLTMGFDQIDKLMNSIFSGEVQSSNYPPYNIERIEENDYRISMAVAGFSNDDLDINVEGSKLVISGKKKTEQTCTEEKTCDDEPDCRCYLHKGIAQRSFIRKFELAGNIEVTGANLEHGILAIDLHKKAPEKEKVRNIKINADPVEKTEIHKK